jgi:SAM-dependent methyltransferase
LSSSYDAIPDFGLLYDSVPLYVQRQDVAFYVDEANSARGTVLELGCGTGRILLPIARAGCTIVGVDNSRQMLARCRSKLATEPAEVRQRVSLHQHDVRDFDLGASYALAIAPFRMFQQLPLIDDQLRFLAAAHRHLQPGGRLVFDVFNPNFAMLTGANGQEKEDTPEQSLPDGRVFRRTYRIALVRWMEQTTDSELIYYVSPRPGAPAERFVQAFEMRWYLRAELEHLLARSGFRVREVYGDFARGALRDGAPEQVVIAERG